MPAKKGIDTRVYIFMGLVILIALVIVLFRYFTADNCPDVGFVVSTEDVYVGQPVEFRDTTQGATSWYWDLGADSRKEMVQSFTHTFTTAGTYTISLKVNECDDEAIKKIIVKPEMKIEPVDSVFLMPVIEGPTTAYVGDKVQFFDKTPGSPNTSWEWYFESGLVDSKEKDPFYSFKRPGAKKVVTLIVNGSSQQARWEINVLNKKKEPGAQPSAPGKPAPPKMSKLEAPELQAMLMQVANREILPSRFKEKLCNDLSIRIMNNDKPITFSSYCTTIRTLQPKSIRVIDIVYDTDNCIKSIKLQTTE